jgi:hypothetical protein
MPQYERSRLRELFRRLTGWLRRPSRKEPEPPVDPYAYVTAPKKPKPSNRSGAAVAELSED